MAPQGSRPIRKPKHRWIDKSKKELRQLGIYNVSEVALNRDRDGTKFVFQTWASMATKIDEKNV